MSKVVKYKEHSYALSYDNVDLEDVKKSMAQIHPELNDAIVFESDNEIYFVSKEKALQNQLDMSLKNQPAISLHHTFVGYTPASAEEKSRSPSPPTHLMGGMGNRMLSWERSPDTRPIGRKSVDEYTLEILGEYAERGGYKHLVGKKCKIIEYNHDLSVYVVKVKDEEKNYVIRKNDIKTQEE